MTFVINFNAINQSQTFSYNHFHLTISANHFFYHHQFFKSHHPVQLQTSIKPAVVFTMRHFSESFFAFLGIFYPKTLQESSKKFFIMFHIIKISICLYFSNPTALFAHPMDNFMKKLLRFCCITCLVLITRNSARSHHLKNVTMQLKPSHIVIASILTITTVAVEWTPVITVADITLKIACIHYALIVQAISGQFRSVYRELKKLSLTHEQFKSFIGECEEFGFRHEHKELPFEGKIARLMKVHGAIVEKVLMLNGFYGIVMLVVIFTTFMGIMSGGYDFFVEIETTMTVDVMAGEVIFIWYFYGILIIG
jgi:hypothetical protein